MKTLIRRLLLATSLLAIVVLALGQPVRAQPTTTVQTDQASYVPGGSGTLTVTLINSDPTNTLEIRNLTVYFPWAEYVNGQWPSGANTTQNLSPWPILGSAQSGNNIKTYSFSFTIPSWFSGSVFSTGPSCAPSDGPRYSTSYHGCVIVGYTASPPQYSGLRYSISMATPTYTPASITTEWLPIATLAVLVIVAALLVLVWTSTRRLSKK